MKCFKCNVTVETTSQLLEHFNTHGIVSGHSFTETIFCGFEGCSRSYLYTYSLKRHLEREHNCVVKSDSKSLPAFPEYPAAVDEAEIREETAVFNFELLESQALGIIHELNASTQLPQTKVQHIVDNVTELVDNFKIEIIKQVRSLVKEDNPELETFLENLADFKPLEKVSTTYRQVKYFESSDKFVPPVNHVISMEYKPRTDSATGVVKQHATPCSFQYIPIHSTLKLFLETPGVLDAISNKPKSGHPEELTQFQDGKLYKSSPTLQKQDVQILLYTDDFEVANPLGAKAGLHKLGALYFSVNSLPSEFSSSLSNCFLVALYKSANAKKYGLEVILKPIVEDLKQMEHQGIHICTKNFTGLCRVGVCQVVGDNLGVHGILGFSEGFTANFPCRMCKVHRAVLRKQTIADPTLQRTKENYAEDVHTNSLPETGVKHNSTLNQLDSFHAATNFAPDLMHDLLEGVCPYEVSLVVGALVGKDVCSLAELNGRITSFDYGFSDSRNKPFGLTPYNLANPDASCGQTASQMWCLMRHLPLLVGDKVEEDDQHFELLLLLRQIMDIVFAPSISFGETIYLKSLIADHHELFLELFPDRHLKPKHHFMLHYPNAIQQVGPLLPFWAMRFEAKHNFFKRFSHTTCNFRDIAKSMARKHQIHLCHNLMLSSSIQSREVQVSSGFVAPVGALSQAETIADQLQCALTDTVFCAKWVSIHGTKYRPGSVVVISLRTCDADARFARVTEVLLLDSSVHLVVQQFRTSHFNRHLHSYCVELIGTSVQLLQPHELGDYRVLHATRAYQDDEHWYIATRYRL